MGSLGSVPAHAGLSRLRHDVLRFVVDSGPALVGELSRIGKGGEEFEES